MRHKFNVGKVKFKDCDCTSKKGCKIIEVRIQNFNNVQYLVKFPSGVEKYVPGDRLELVEWK